MTKLMIVENDYDMQLLTTMLVTISTRGAGLVIFVKNLSQFCLTDQVVQKEYSGLRWQSL